MRTSKIEIPIELITGGITSNTILYYCIRWKPLVEQTTPGADQGQKKIGVLLTISLCSTKGPLGVYLLLYCAISLKIFLVRQKYICFGKQIFFDGKPKMTKKFEFEKLKVPNSDIWPFWEIFNF